MEAYFQHLKNKKGKVGLDEKKSQKLTHNYDNTYKL